MVSPGQARNHRITMGRCEFTDSPWEGGYHRFPLGRWKPQIHLGKMKTTESPWKGGNHRVTTGRWKL